MSEKQIRVSVLCLAYNHAKYIRNALDGFVSQETDFDYEVIIHDDASTDETASIIREYAERYPEIIRPVFQTENQYRQKIPIWATHVNHLIRGQYVALCEGDDFWTDPNKLQRQFDILESHPDCSMCVHTVQLVNEDGTSTGAYRPSTAMEEGALDTRQFLKVQQQYPFHTSSYFMRKDLWLDHTYHPAAFRKASDVGDEPMLLYMVAHGNIYYIPACMSAYRLFSVGSWSSVHKRSVEKRLSHAQKMYEMMCLYDEYTNHAYDCNLAMFRGKALWLSENYRELVKKENRLYVKQCKLIKKAFIYICAVFPFVRNLRRLLFKEYR